MSIRAAIISVVSLLIIGAAEHNQSPFYAEPREIVLTFVGDVMSHRENIRSKPYPEAFRMIVDDLGFGDLTFANFEFVLDESRPPSGYPWFNAPISYVDAVIGSGVNVVSLANNHSADLGVEGVIATKRALDRYRESHGVVSSGIATDPSERFSIELIQLDGFRVGFLAVTGFLNVFIDLDLVNVADYNRSDQAAELIQIVEQNRDRYDFFVLSYHGGVEYSRVPVDAKERFFGKLIDAGVDVLWAHHPHVLQPWRIYSGSQRSGLIMYSLGNFISAQPYYLNVYRPDDPRAPRGESIMLRLVVTPGGEISGVESIPIMHLRDDEGFIRVLPVSRLDSLPLSDAATRFYQGRSESLTRYVDENQIRDRF